jgi:hypothetical protein
MYGLLTPAEQEVSDPVCVLAHERFVQTEFDAQIRQHLGGGVDPEYNLGRIARQDEENREYRNGDQKQEQNQSDQFF